MKCPYCGKIEDKVIDSRLSNADEVIRRRRECIACSRRYTTYERREETPLMIIKKDGRREPFDRNKLLGGILKACEKRPISMDKIEGLVDGVEMKLIKDHENEASSTELGEIVIRALQDLDDIAYVRFASVYRQFKDINQFMRELRDILGKDK